MDNTKKLGHVSLCAGYGGIDLGLRGAVSNLRTVAFSEIEAYACANLVSKMEAGLLDCAPIWTDLKTFPWKSFRDKIYLLSGGYPCQPFSHAGKRLGTDDPRHLWPFIRNGIKTARPVWCFFENVEGHLSLGFKEVQQSLRRLGYRVEAGIFSAAEVGAPHRRKRLFVLAKRKDCGCGGWPDKDGDDCDRISERETDKQSILWSEVAGCSGVARGKELVNPSSDGCAGGCAKTMRTLGQSEERWLPESPGGRDQLFWPARPGCEQYDWEPSRTITDANGKAGKLGNSEDQRRQESRQIERRILKPSGRRQIESPLGRNANGTADRLGYGELCVSCDNRTDELRLLGNGVVPATATKAFLTLMEKF